MERKTLISKPIIDEKIGNYFLENKNLEFVSSGCKILDCVLGGGYPLGRIANIVGDKSTGKCIKDAYILTSIGMHKIDNIGNNFNNGATPWKETLTVKKDEHVLTSHFYKEIVTETIRITTKYGYQIEGTPDHKIMTQEFDFEMNEIKVAQELKSLKSIKKGDTAVIVKEAIKFPNLYYLLGNVVIDEKVGEALGILTRSENFNCIPNCILQSPKPVQSLFLRNIIDSTSYIEDSNIYYNTPHKELANQVHLMLLNFGIISNFTNRPQPKQYDKYTCYEIIIPKEFISLYFIQIGSTRYETPILEESYKLYNNSDYFYDPIETIEYLSNKVEVFDVHIPNTHLFWANGFINHNTLLAIEACANFHKSYPTGIIKYHEAEAAFDKDYAQALGLPTERISFIEDKEDPSTVEGFFNNLIEFMTKTSKDKIPGIYILDSLDALSSLDEKGRDIKEGSYGMAKAKKMSELFRRLVKDIEKTRVLLLIISQVRDKINISFGKKHDRAGGRALDFYASQVVWLSEVEKIKKSVKGIERVIGIGVKGKCNKNKVGLPYRECEFPVIFGFGVEDLIANLEWLQVVYGDTYVKELLDLIQKDFKLKLPAFFDKKILPISLIVNFIRSREENKEIAKVISEHTIDVWQSIETQFLPKGKKY